VARFVTPAVDGSSGDAPGPGLDRRAWDVVVVGAGPAGAVVALGLARRSLSVLLLDRQAFPRRKVCGACLSRGALEVLAGMDLGSLAGDHGAVPLDRLELTAWGTKVQLPLQGSSALSREVFDAALVAEAVRAGATFSPETRATLGPLGPGDREVRIRRAGTSMLLRARVVVAADGLAGAFLGGSSGVRTGTPARGARVGVGAVFEADAAGYPYRAIHMAVGHHGYVGAVRLEDGRLNVAAALDPALVRTVRSPGKAVACLLDEAGAPALPDRPQDGWSGTPTLTRRPARLGEERVFAVGDASGYVEPFTGEGMTWAMAGARALTPLLARAADRWTPQVLEEWEAWHARRLRPAQRLCRTVAWTLRRPTLSRGTARLLRRFPWMAAPVLRGASTHPRIPLESNA
jgi:flavin-dependent dehydrogenase